MLYLVIERFHEGKQKTLYLRFEKEGRMLPDGVKYIDSWINESVTVCYQLMESKSEDGIAKWIDKWKDVGDFEVVPVIRSDEAKKRVLGLN